MKIKIYLVFLFLITGIFSSCAWRTPTFYIPVPDFSVYDPQNIIDTENITGTMNSDGSMPDWLLAFIENGISEVEDLAAYKDKYVFIGVNRGTNFPAMTRWAVNFSAAQDLALLAAERIERRMILNASFYPDNEYGRFFDTMIISASNNEYRGALKEDTYWYKTSPYNPIETNGSSQEIYYYFVLITIEKEIFQVIINNMMEHSQSVSTATVSQAAAISRLRQNFFEGF